MNEVEKLIQRAKSRNCRIQMRFDPQEVGEEWGIKFYPEDDDDAHFYAYSNDLNTAAHKILDELQGFSSW